MEKSITLHVGLDLHKDSIDVATADIGREDVVPECHNARRRLKDLLLRNGITYAAGAAGRPRTCVGWPR